MGIISKLMALLEVALILAVIWLVSFGIFNSPLGVWQQQNLGRHFTTHILYILVPVIWLGLTRRSLTGHGIALRNFKADAVAAMSCFFPVAIAMATLGFLPYTEWGGSLIEVLINLVLLWLVGRTLTAKPNPNSGLLTVFLAVLMFGGYSAWKNLFPGPGQALANFVYFILVGFGEETLFRGYILGRLNQAFGKSYRFYGVSWGAGAILAALTFGFSHIFNGFDPISGQFNPQWAWGLWTIFSGLVFTYIREKTGSIVAPAIVHGLPQALVYLFVRPF